MRQLVGSTCTACDQKIESVLEGTICDECHGVVHSKCRQAPAESKDESHCTGCGCDLEKVNAALKARKETPRKSIQLGQQVERPFSKVCPKCGGVTFSRVRSQKWVSFTNDRKCKECGTCYTPPTPVWGAVAMIVVGLFLVASWGISFFFRIQGGQIFAVPAMACEGFLGFLGLVAIGQGFRGLQQAELGDVSDSTADS